MKFRKKSVIIEARQFDGSWASTKPILDWMEPDRPIDRSGASWSDREGGKLHIHMLDGTLTASPGDWIIKGISNEFYLCKPDIFAATYEAVE